MKTLQRIFPIAALCAVLLWSSCNTGTKPGGGGSGDKVSLEVNLTPGMVYKQVTKVEQNSEQSVMGMKTKTSSTTETYMVNEVLSVSPEGIAEVKCTYERIKMVMDNGIAGKTTYDSDKDSSGLPPQSIAYAGMVGRTIGFKIDKRGTVVGVTGVDSLVDNAVKSISLDMSATEIEMMKKTIKMTMGDDAMKSMMQSASIQYPDVLVAEGDTWGKQVGQMGAIPLKMDINYKVDHIDGDKVVLGFEGTIVGDKDKALDLGIMEMEMDLTGKSTGTSEINRKTGMVMTSTVHQTMEGSMKMMGMSIPMSIEQTVTVNPY